MTSRRQSLQIANDFLRHSNSIDYNYRTDSMPGRSSSVHYATAEQSKLDTIRKQRARLVSSLAVPGADSGIATTSGASAPHPGREGAGPSPNAGGGTTVVNSATFASVDDGSNAARRRQKDVALSRSLGRRYLPSQRPFAALPCAAFVTPADMVLLADFFHWFNVLPNAANLEQVVLPPQPQPDQKKPLQRGAKPKTQPSTSMTILPPGCNANYLLFEAERESDDDDTDANGQPGEGGQSSTSAEKSDSARKRRNQENFVYSIEADSSHGNLFAGSGDAKAGTTAGAADVNNTMSGGLKASGSTAKKAAAAAAMSSSGGILMEDDDKAIPKEWLVEILMIFIAKNLDSRTIKEHMRTSAVATATRKPQSSPSTAGQQQQRNSTTTAAQEKGRGRLSTSNLGASGYNPPSQSGTMTDWPTLDQLDFLTQSSREESLAVSEGKRSGGGKASVTAAALRRRRLPVLRAREELLALYRADLMRWADPLAQECSTHSGHTVWRLVSEQLELLSLLHEYVYTTHMRQSYDNGQEAGKGATGKTERNSFARMRVRNSGSSNSGINTLGFSNSAPLAGSRRPPRGSGISNADSILSGALGGRKESIPTQLFSSVVVPAEGPARDDDELHSSESNLDVDNEMTGGGDGGGVDSDGGSSLAWLRDAQQPVPRKAARVASDDGADGDGDFDDAVGQDGDNDDNDRSGSVAGGRTLYNLWYGGMDAMGERVAPTLVDVLRAPMLWRTRLDDFVDATAAEAAQRETERSIHSVTAMATSVASTATYGPGRGVTGGAPGSSVAGSARATTAANGNASSVAASKVTTASTAVRRRRRRDFAETQYLVCWSDLSNNLLMESTAVTTTTHFGTTSASGSPSGAIAGVDPNGVSPVEDEEARNGYVKVPSLLLDDTAAGVEPGGANAPETRLACSDGSGSDDGDGDDDADGAVGGAAGGSSRRRQQQQQQQSGDSAQRGLAGDVEAIAEAVEALHRQSADHVLVSATYNRIVTSSKDGIIKMWAVRYGQFEKNLLNVGGAWVIAMEFILQEQFLVVFTSDAEVTVLDFPEGNIALKYRGCMTLLTALREVTQAGAGHVQRFGMRPGECGPHKLAYREDMSPATYSRKRREAQSTGEQKCPVRPVEGYVTPTAGYLDSALSFYVFGTAEGVLGCLDFSKDFRKGVILAGTDTSRPLHVSSAVAAHPSSSAVTGILYCAVHNCVLSCTNTGSLVRTPVVAVQAARGGGYELLPGQAIVAEPRLKAIRFLSYSAALRTFATVHSDRRVLLWSISRSGTDLAHQFPQQSQDVISIAFVPAQSRVALLAADHVVSVYELRGISPVAVMALHNTNGNHAEDMASVAAQCSAGDGDGCLGVLAGKNRLVCALRGPIMYDPMAPRGAAAAAAQQRSAKQLKAEGGPSATDDEGESATPPPEEEEGETSEEYRTRVEAWRLQHAQRRAETIYLRRLKAFTTHSRGVIATALHVASGELHTLTSDRWRVWHATTGALLRETELTRAIHEAFPALRRLFATAASWTTPAQARLLVGGRDGLLATLDPANALVAIAEEVIPRQSGPHFGAKAGEGKSETKGSAGEASLDAARDAAAAAQQRDVGSVTVSGALTFIAGGSTCVVRRYVATTATSTDRKTNPAGGSGTARAGSGAAAAAAVRPNGEENYTAVTLYVPAPVSSITACCSVRDSHACLGTADCRLLFYRLSDTTGLPYREEFLRDPNVTAGTGNNNNNNNNNNSNGGPGSPALSPSTPSTTATTGGEEVGAIVSLTFANEYNQNMIIAMLDTGVVYFYSNSQGIPVGRAHLFKANECRLTCAHFTSHSGGLAMVNSSGGSGGGANSSAVGSKAPTTSDAAVRNGPNNSNHSGGRTSNQVSYFPQFTFCGDSLGRVRVVDLETHSVTGAKGIGAGAAASNGPAASPLMHNPLGTTAGSPAAPSDNTSLANSTAAATVAGGILGSSIGGGMHMGNSTLGAIAGLNVGGPTDWRRATRALHSFQATMGGVTSIQSFPAIWYVQHASDSAGTSSLTGFSPRVGETSGDDGGNDDDEVPDVRFTPRRRQRSGANADDNGRPEDGAQPLPVNGDFNDKDPGASEGGDAATAAPALTFAVPVYFVTVAGLDGNVRLFCIHPDHISPSFAHTTLAGANNSSSREQNSSISASNNNSNFNNSSPSAFPGDENLFLNFVFLGSDHRCGDPDSGGATTAGGGKRHSRQQQQLLQRNAQPLPPNAIRGWSSTTVGLYGYDTWRLGDRDTFSRAALPPAFITETERRSNAFLSQILRSSKNSLIQRLQSSTNANTADGSPQPGGTATGAGNTTASAGGASASARGADANGGAGELRASTGAAGGTLTGTAGDASAFSGSNGATRPRRSPAHDGDNTLGGSTGGNNPLLDRYAHRHPLSTLGHPVHTLLAHSGPQDGAAAAGGGEGAVDESVSYSRSNRYDFPPPPYDAECDVSGFPPQRYPAPGSTAWDFGTNYNRDCTVLDTIIRRNGSSRLGGNDDDNDSDDGDDGEGHTGTTAEKVRRYRQVMKMFPVAMLKRMGVLPANAPEVDEQGNPRSVPAEYIFNFFTSGGGAAGGGNAPVVLAASPFGGDTIMHLGDLEAYDGDGDSASSPNFFLTGVADIGGNGNAPGRLIKSSDDGTTTPRGSQRAPSTRAPSLTGFSPTIVDAGDDAGSPGHNAVNHAHRRRTLTEAESDALYDSRRANSIAAGSENYSNLVSQRQSIVTSGSSIASMMAAGMAARRSVTGALQPPPQQQPQQDRRKSSNKPFRDADAFEQPKTKGKKKDVVVPLLSSSSPASPSGKEHDNATAAQEQTPEPLPPPNMDGGYRFPEDSGAWSPAQGRTEEYYSSLDRASLTVVDPSVDGISGESRRVSLSTMRQRGSTVGSVSPPDLGPLSALARQQQQHQSPSPKSEEREGGSTAPPSHNQRNIVDSTSEETSTAQPTHERPGGVPRKPLGKNVFSGKYWSPYLPNETDGGGSPSEGSRGGTGGRDPGVSRPVSGVSSGTLGSGAGRVGAFTASHPRPDTGSHETSAPAAPRATGVGPTAGPFANVPRYSLQYAPETLMAQRELVSHEDTLETLQLRRDQLMLAHFAGSIDSIQQRSAKTYGQAGTAPGGKAGAAATAPGVGMYRQEKLMEKLSSAWRERETDAGALQATRAATMASFGGAGAGGKAGKKGGSQHSHPAGQDGTEKRVRPPSGGEAGGKGAGGGNPPFIGLDLALLAVPTEDPRFLQKRNQQRALNARSAAAGANPKTAAAEEERGGKIKHGKGGGDGAGDMEVVAAATTGGIAGPRIRTDPLSNTERLLNIAPPDQLFTARPTDGASPTASAVAASAASTMTGGDAAGTANGAVTLEDVDERFMTAQERYVRQRDAARERRQKETQQRQLAAEANPAPRAWLPTIGSRQTLMPVDVTVPSTVIKAASAGPSGPSTTSANTRGHAGGASSASPWQSSLPGGLGAKPTTAGSDGSDSSQDEVSRPRRGGGGGGGRGGHHQRHSRYSTSTYGSPLVSGGGGGGGGAASSVIGAGASASTTVEMQTRQLEALRQALSQDNYQRYSETMRRAGANNTPSPVSKPNKSPAGWMDGPSTTAMYSPKR